MCVCRQCAETKLWIIGYTRSIRDEKQMMSTCVDNMQMTWTMCVCVDNVWKLSLYIIEYIKSTTDDVWMTYVMCTSSTCHLHIIYFLLPLQLDPSPRNSKTQKVKETRLISQKVK